MALRSALTKIQPFKGANFKWTLYNPGTGNGLIEPQVGWLVCNGAAVSRTTYASLFTKIGTAYGVGDGSTTFNLPDARDGVVPIPMGATNFPTRGARGGTYAETLTGASTPPHAHGSMYDSFHPRYVNDGNWAPKVYPPNGYDGAFTRNTNGEPNNGSYGVAHENMPPVQVVGCLLIKY